MFCITIVLTLSIALIVLMGGLFLLAYSKKEGLGLMSKIASYVAVAFGSVLFVGCIVCCLMCHPCDKSNCGKNQESCGMMGGDHKMSGKGDCAEGKKDCCKSGQKHECNKKATLPK